MSFLNGKAVTADYMKKKRVAKKTDDRPSAAIRCRIESDESFSLGNFAHPTPKVPFEFTPI